MPGQDQVKAPAVCSSLALCELREYALHSPHLSFGPAMRRAMVDALEGAARCAAQEAAREAVDYCPSIAVRREIGDF